jgi:hypothetical protein
MLIGAAVAAGGELTGAMAAAGGAALIAAEVSDAAAGDASTLDGAVAPAATKPTASEPPNSEPPAEDSPTDTGGSCRTNSFAAGTAVMMADGSSKPIQDVHVGDQIANQDPENGQVQTHTVMATHITDNDHDFVELAVRTPTGISTIAVTVHHLFRDSSENSRVESGNLAIGDRLDTAGQGVVTVAANRHYTGSLRTYNLTVDQVHTFFVGSAAVFL